MIFMSKKTSIMRSMKRLFFAALMGVFATLSACSDEGLNLGLNVNNLASTPDSLAGTTWHASYTGIAGSGGWDSIRVSGSQEVAVELDFFSTDSCTMRFTYPDPSAPTQAGIARYTYRRPRATITFAQGDLPIKNIYSGEVAGNILTLPLGGSVGTLDFVMAPQP
jgi:hypothetical protein